MKAETIYFIAKSAICFAVSPFAGAAIGTVLAVGALSLGAAALFAAL